LKEITNSIISMVVMQGQSDRGRKEPNNVWKIKNNQPVTKKAGAKSEYKVGRVTPQ